MGKLIWWQDDWGQDACELNAMLRALSELLVDSGVLTHGEVKARIVAALKRPANYEVTSQMVAPDLSKPLSALSVGGARPSSVGKMRRPPKRSSTPELSQSVARLPEVMECASCGKDVPIEETHKGRDGRICDTCYQRAILYPK